MDLLGALTAIFKLGLPMTIASWLAFRWIYGTGEVDRDTNHKELKSSVNKKNIRSFAEKTKDKRAQFILEKWAAFGSGFYGLTGLWTFIVIEAGELYNFIASGGPAGFLDEGLISLIIDILINQIGNFFTALLWFTYWPGEDDSMLLWIIVAFIGYRLGIEVARGRVPLPNFASGKTQ